MCLNLDGYFKSFKYSLNKIVWFATATNGKDYKFYVI